MKPFAVAALAVGVTAPASVRQSSAQTPVPLTLLVDDPTPILHLYRHHIVEMDHNPKPAAGGKALAKTIPNRFLAEFCDAMERQGIKGKISIVPAPEGKGDVARGIEGYAPALTRDWIRTAKKRLSGRFDFTPEMLTHSWAVDLASGRLLDERENTWSTHQNRSTLTPYLTKALSLLKEAGVDATGFTSPWDFGIKVEPEYIEAMVAAQKKVYGRKFSWYFLHCEDDPAIRPKVVYRKNGVTLVSISSSMPDDALWDTIWKYGKADKKLVSKLADHFLTADGTGGLIPKALQAGGWPVLLTHWQTLYSNGNKTGLKVIEEVGRRVKKSLAGRVRWVSCLEMAELAAGEKISTKNDKGNSDKRR